MTQAERISDATVLVAQAESVLEVVGAAVECDRHIANAILGAAALLRQAQDGLNAAEVEAGKRGRGAA